MKGKLPFPKWILNTDVIVYKEVPGTYGPTQSVLFSGKANYDPKSKSVMTAEKQLVTISGKVVCQGDIDPSSPKIEGYVKIGGESRKIFRSLKPMNPDGTVFSTELELM